MILGCSRWLLYESTSSLCDILFFRLSQDEEDEGRQDPAMQSDFNHITNTGTDRRVNSACVKHRVNTHYTQTSTDRKTNREKLNTWQRELNDDQL